MAKQLDDVLTADLLLPDLPRRRGRPATGCAKTPAQRKAAQRARLFEWSKDQVLCAEDVARLRPVQLMELIPRYWAAGDYEAVSWAAAALKSLAQGRFEEQKTCPDR